MGNLLIVLLPLLAGGLLLLYLVDPTLALFLVGWAFFLFVLIMLVGSSIYWISDRLQLRRRPRRSNPGGGRGPRR